MRRRFEWDEEKAALNLIRHKISFNEARMAFRDDEQIVATSIRGDEVRFVTTGTVDQRIISVVWTERGDVTRIISARSARRGERRKYRPLHS